MESAKSLLTPGACGFIKPSETKNYVTNELKLRIQKLEKTLQLKQMNFVNFLQIQSGRNYTSKKRKKNSAYQCFQSLSKYPDQLNLLPGSRQLLNAQRKSEVIT